MQFNTTELDSTFAPLEEYKPAPSRWDTLKASMDNFTSVNLSNSKDRNYKAEMKLNTKEWQKVDPKNQDLYERFKRYSVRDVEKLEALYEQNDTEAIKGFIQTNPFNVDVFLADDFLKIKELQKQHGFADYNTIKENANSKARQEYEETARTLEDSEYWGMELLGTMGGALQDVATLQTLLLGTWKAGGTVAANAGRAILEEMGIETLAQFNIAPEVYAYKRELGIKTSIAQEAGNAAMSIGTAGLMRGVGSAAFDLTEQGIKALRVKDPQLASDYEALTKGQPTQDVKEHIDNLHKAEFGDAPDTIRNPNEQGDILNKSEPIKEYDIPEIKQKEDIISEELMTISGIDEKGEFTYKTYKEILDEHDKTDLYINKAKDCFL